VGQRCLWANRFNPAQVDQLLLNWNGAGKRVNLELFGKPTELKPGESVTLEHSYEVQVGEGTVGFWPRESKAAKKERAKAICAGLMKAHPDATIALHFSSNWELLVATILSAQSTDVKVNEVTADLFSKYRTLQDYASADPTEFEEDIHATGFFRNKTKSIIGAAKAILEQFGGEVPGAMEELLQLPGVARKTANVVLGAGFGIAEGFVVDTHIARLSLRMGLTPRQKTKAINTDKIEKDLMDLIPQEHWTQMGHALIWHGRRICDAKKPLCAECPVAELCPKVGVKPK